MLLLLCCSLRSCEEPRLTWLSARINVLAIPTQGAADNIDVAVLAAAGGDNGQVPSGGNATARNGVEAVRFGLANFAMAACDTDADIDAVCRHVARAVGCRQLDPDPAVDRAGVGCIA